MMPFSFRERKSAGKVAIGVVVALLVVAGTAGALFSIEGWGGKSRPAAVLPEASGSIVDLGITYLTVSTMVSDHYQLGCNSGVLVTGVSKGSLADRAGIRSGDVILAFNGQLPGPKEPLLGMIRRCQPCQSVAIEVWRDNGIRLVKLGGTSE